jgi:recombination protein RecA
LEQLKKSCIFTKKRIVINLKPNIMSADKEAKLKALQLTLDKLDKTYGKGAVMKLGDSAVEEIEAIPSGSLGVDLALGVNGYPRGRVIEIYGPESSGKTTLTLHAIAEAQKAGGIAAFIDAEHAFDRFYAEKLGVDIDNLIISQPDNGEQALRNCRKFNPLGSGRYCRN